MVSRGTLGMRMSRLRVDGLLNNTSYFRCYPSTTNRRWGYNMPSNPIPFSNTSYVSIGSKALPATYLDGCSLVCSRTLYGNDPACTVSSKVQKNGVDVAGTEHSMTGQMTPVKISDTLYGLRAGDAVNIVTKVNNAVYTGYYTEFGLYCDDEGIVQAVGPGNW